jgi:hypothetical protein
VPIIASDIPDFHQLADQEGLAIDFVEPGEPRAIAEHLLALLQSPERQMEMGLQNVSAALRMSMPEIMRQYLRGFQLQQGLGRLTTASKLRRLPRWLPLRDKFVRVAGKRAFAKTASGRCVFPPPEEGVNAGEVANLPMRGE